jgi:hypothetical protein
MAKYTDLASFQIKPSYSQINIMDVMFVISQNKHGNKHPMLRLLRGNTSSGRQKTMPPCL